MRKTEKQFWQNGHQKRGKKFHTLAFSILSIGVMIYCNGNFFKGNGIEIYKLV